MTLLDQPHHDGSELYVTNPAPSLGEVVPVLVRVPHGAGVAQVHLRTTVDGEPRYVEAVVDRTDERETWWRADLHVDNPVTAYRWLLSGGTTGYAWLQGGGVTAHDPTDAGDFRLPSYAAPPAWLSDAVCYQIFPDRFARSGEGRPLPEWAIAAEWDDRIASGWHEAVRQVYGGDLGGIEQRLGHLEALGVNLLYLTPFFPATSSHRYNATTFEHVDPLLGDDEALASLTKACHARGIRVIGDLTTNHSGDKHAWFRRAQADLDTEEAGYYFFGDGADDYVAWYGVRSLPKFDMRSPELRRAMLQGPDSIVGRWVREPFSLDGWRIDVANMTGRLGEIDVNHEVAATIRATLAEVRPDAYLVAEHCYDASQDLLGDGWHGTMNYAGFTRAAWCWLRRRPDIRMMGIPVDTPDWPGGLAAATMRAFLAAVPWRSACADLNLLDSHDTARFRTVVGDDTERQLAGVALLMTFPGVPMVFAGDEVGCAGDDTDAARVTFPWDERRWDRRLYEGYRALIALRRSSRALRVGGLRWVHIGDDTLVFLRESAGERVLVQVSRAPHAPVRLPAALLGRGAEVLHGAPLAERDGVIELPADGPAANIWRIGP